MERILSDLFGQLLGRYGVVTALVAITVLAMVAVAAYYAKSRIDIMRREAEQNDKERAQEHASREEERHLLLDEVKASRDQMLNHMGLDRREKDRLTRTLGSMISEIRAQVKVLDGLSSSIKDHSDKSEERAGRVYQKLEEVRLDIAKKRGGNGAP